MSEIETRNDHICMMEFEIDVKFNDVFLVFFCVFGAAFVGQKCSFEGNNKSPCGFFFHRTFVLRKQKLTELLAPKFFFSLKIRSA